MPASTATSSVLWHSVEHVPCTPGARAERAYCTTRARADTLAPRLWPALQHLATHSPSHRNAPSSPAAPDRPSASRRHRPGQSGTSSTSPSPFSSPGTSSSSREPFPLLDFDREPTPPQSHFATEAFFRRGARRRQLTPSPPTQRLPGGPPQPYGSIPTLGGPRGAAKRRRRSPEPRSARAEEGDDARRLVKPDQWARRAHCR